MSQDRPRWWQRLLQRIGATRAGAWLFSRTAHRTDLILMPLTGGRVSTASVLAGLPTVRLTTIGAKTGKERTVPVMGLQDDEKWILIASNFGNESHPAWYHNLRTNPEVKLTYNDQTNQYIAREATGEERSTYWNRAKELYVGFEAYQRWASGRQIPVVILEPVDE